LELGWEMPETSCNYDFVFDVESDEDIDEPIGIIYETSGKVYGIEEINDEMLLVNLE
jgi:hypothetical protein